jgi:acid phosphatase type 7
MYKTVVKVLLAFLLVGLSAIAARAQTEPLQINFRVHTPFRFVAYGDTRFTDPANTRDTNPEVRQELVRVIASIRPAFIAFGGDIPFNGFSADDWKVYDRETSIWRERRITVFPALGNHELRGDTNVALANYFARFPNLHEHRYYAVRAANTLLLTLDSSLDETTGSQGAWLSDQFKHLPADVDFVFVSLHHPPITSAGDKTNGRGGSSARPAEQQLAAFLEQQQKNLRARIVVFASHVHNYERHERGGVTYFVTGGGGAHAYPIARAANDPYQSREINYHYILVEVERGKLKATMNRVEVKDGVAKWTQPDSVMVSCPLKIASRYLALLSRIRVTMRSITLRTENGLVM